METQAVGKPQVMARPIPRVSTQQDVRTRDGRTKDGLRPVCHSLHERIDEVNDVQAHETNFETAQKLGLRPAI